MVSFSLTTWALIGWASRDPTADFVGWSVLLWPFIISCSHFWLATLK